MADFFDRLLAKASPSPAATDSDGVRSVAAQPRLPHPFERPGTAGDLDWDEQPSSESEYSRRGNAMELRSEPAFGPRTAAPALPRSDGPVSAPPRPDARLSAEPDYRPLIVLPATSGPPLPGPSLTPAAPQHPGKAATPPAPTGFLGIPALLGDPGDRIPPTATPTPRPASALPSPTPQARLSERGAPPAGRAPAAPPPPSVTVRIGRLEVRAATPPATRPASGPDRRTREPTLKLEEYLSREGGRR